MDAFSVLKSEVQAVRDASAELRRRLREGEVIRVEDLLERNPELAKSDEVILELIHVEISTRSERGEQATLHEWRERFPRLLPQMEQRLSKNGMIGSEMPTLADAAAASRTDAVPENGLARLPKIGNYQVFQEIGRGGMGVVYKARQTRLSRIVAIKMILAGEHAGLRDRVRLRIEAEAAAQLLHPNVVQVFEIGEHEGLPFLAMEYVPGGNLMRMLRGKPQAFRWSTRLTETLARAIHEAHKRNIVHRDLNPSNILISHDGTPKISDFGLAKFLVDDHGVSMNGVILGTPSYMAPEQVSGNGALVGPATDVYALGALLYEMLTGTAPFRGFTPMETLCQVMEAELVPPSRLRHGVPEDLETICLKCLDREPSKRYASAEDLADDLKRYSENQPIRARRISRFRKLMHWRRRQPLAANLLVLSLLLSLLLLGLAADHVAGLWTETDRLKREFEAEQRRISQRAQQERRLEAENHKAFQQRYDLRLSQIKQSFDAGQVELAQELFKELELGDERRENQGFEWQYLSGLLKRTSRSLEGHPGKVKCLSFTRSGGTMLSGDDTGQLLVWALPGGSSRPIKGRHDSAIQKVAIDADAEDHPRAFASVSENQDASLDVRIWDPHTSQAIAALYAAPFEEKPSWQLASLSFAPDGQTLTLCGGSPDAPMEDRLVWKRKGDTWQREPDRRRGRRLPRAFSSDGSLQVEGQDDGTVVVRDAKGATSAPLEQRAGGAALAVAVSSDARRLVVSRADGTFTVWELATGKILLHSTGLEAPATFVSFCLDEKTVVGSDGKRLVWTQSLSETVRQSLPPSSHSLTSLKLSPDLRMLAGGGWNQPLTIWDLSQGTRESSYLPTGRLTRDFAFASDSNVLVFCCGDPAIRVWNFREGEETNQSLKGHTGEVWSLAFSPDSKVLASSGDDHLVRLWDPRSQKELLTLAGHDQTVTALAFLEGGEKLVSAGLDGKVILWKLHQEAHPEARLIGEQLWSHQYEGDRRDRLCAVSVSSDDRHLAVAGSRGVIDIWDMSTLEHESELKGHTGKISALLYSPNPSVLASVSSDGSVRFWEAGGGSAAALKAKQVGVGLRTLAFSWDGLLLAYAGDDRLIKIFSMSSWLEEEQGHQIHPLAVRSLAFCPRQRVLATGCDDGNIRFWDLDTGQLFYALKGHANRVNGVAFSPDGRLLASCDNEGTIRLWRAEEENAVPPVKKPATMGQ